MDKTKQLTYGGALTALIAVCAWLTIPSPTVPFTMQTFGVFFTLFFLGGKGGTLVVLAYLLLGAVGAPVFAGFQGGVGALFGMTGGYLLGFLAISLVYWMINPKENRFLSCFAMILGLVVCYILGTLQFVLLYSAQVEEMGFVAGLSLCVFPYIIPDLLKLCLAQQMAQRLKKAIPSLRKI